MCRVNLELLLQTGGVKEKVYRFIGLATRRKLLFFTTVLLSFYTFVLMRYFRKKARYERRAMPFDTTPDNSLVKDIRWAIFTVNKYVPWENVCRHQAYQAMILCRRYRIPYRIFVGFRKNPETGEVEGHAWTLVNGDFITGFCTPEEYTVQSVYP